MNKKQLQDELSKAYKNNEFVVAEGLADEYLNRFPEGMSYGQHVAISNIYLHVARYEDALSQVEKAFLLDKKRIDAVQQSFWIYFASDSLEKARNVLDVLNHMDERERNKEIYSRWLLLLEDKNRNFEEIVEAFDRGAVSLDIDASRSGEVISAVVRALCEENRIQDAEQIINALPPAVVESSLNLMFTRAKLTDYQGRLDESVNRYDELLAKFDYPEARWNKTLCLLSLGRELEGWLSFEDRWGWKGYPSGKWTVDAKQWSGEDLTGKSILVLPEQGLGDEILFLTQLPVVEKYNPKKITIQVSNKIVKLVQAWFPNHVVIESPENQDLRQTEQHRDFDFFVNVGSLSLIKIKNDHSVEARLLNLSKTGAQIKQSLVDAGVCSSNAMLVGIAWRSSNYYGARAGHYINYLGAKSIVDSAPADIVFLTLQYKLEPEEIEFLSNSHRIYLPPEDLFENVDACAGYVAACDVVICPPTIIRQIAGVTGTPCITWGIDPHWSHLGKSEYPWYPNVKLIKCDRNWHPGALVTRVKTMVNKFPALFRKH